MKKFLKYWIENLTQSKSLAESIILIIAFFPIVLKVIQILEIKIPFLNEVLVENSGIVCFLSAALLLSRYIFWMPYKRFNNLLLEFEAMKDAKVLEHDTALFKTVDGILDEVSFADLCSQIITNRIVRNTSLNKFSEIHYFNLRAGNQFLDSELLCLFAKFNEDLRNFDAFVSEHFFSMSNSGTKMRDSNNQPYILLQFRPDQKGYSDTDEEGIYYNETYAELVRLGEIVLEDYKNFRTAIKKKLYL